MGIMTRVKTDFPELVLGTAMWGWTVPEEVAFSLLDTYYAAGFRRIDAATNYPINKQPEDFRKSEQILSEWINAHGITDLSILMKVGSLSNLGFPDHNLNPSFLLYNWRYYQGCFGDNLGGLMFHWDNREEEEATLESLTVLQQVAASGLEVGFSGVKFPNLYARVLEKLKGTYLIQLKHHLTYSDYPRYAALRPYGRFYAYGINGGGIKLDPGYYHRNSSLKVRGGNLEGSSVVSNDLNQVLNRFNTEYPEQAIYKMNEAAMTFALQSPGISGVLIGPSQLAQLEESLAFYRKVQQQDYSHLFALLLEIHRRHAPNDRKI